MNQSSPLPSRSISTTPATRRQIDSHSPVRRQVTPTRSGWIGMIRAARTTDSTHPFPGGVRNPPPVADPHPEALALRWDDVSLDHGTAQVTRALQRIELPNGKSELQFVEPKSDRSYRVLAIPKSVVVLLGKHRATQNRERLVAGSRWRSERLVFASTIGTPLDERDHEPVNRNLHQISTRPKRTNLEARL